MTPPFSPPGLPHFARNDTTFGNGTPFVIARSVSDEAISSSIICIMSKQYYVYIMTNKGNTVLYTGVTNDLRKRVYEHTEKLVGGFTKKYNVTELVYYEIFQDVENAIMREKQIKAGTRQKKIDLINRMNKEWRDLYEQL